MHLLSCCCLAFAVHFALLIDGAPETQEPSLPTARELLQCAVDVLGGSQAIEAIESAHFVYTSASVVREERIEYFVKGANNLISRRMSGNQLFEMGTDGEATWNLRCHGNTYLCTAMKGPIGERIHIAKPHRWLHDLSKAPELDLRVVRTNFDGIACYSIPSAPVGGIPMSIYFDMESGMPLGVAELPGPMTSGEIHTFKEWRKFGQVELCTSVVVRKEQGAGGTLMLDEARFNEVDQEMFKRPEAVDRIIAVNGGSLRNALDWQGKVDPRPSTLSPVEVDEIKRMSRAELQQKLGEIAKARQFAKDAGEKQRLQDLWALVLEQLRNEAPVPHD